MLMLQFNQLHKWACDSTPFNYNRDYVKAQSKVILAILTDIDKGVEHLARRGFDTKINNKLKSDIGELLMTYTLYFKANGAFTPSKLVEHLESGWDFIYEIPRDPQIALYFDYKNHLQSLRDELANGAFGLESAGVAMLHAMRAGWLARLLYIISDNSTEFVTIASIMQKSLNQRIRQPLPRGFV